MSEKVFELVARIMGVPVDQVTEASSPKTLEKWDSLRHMKLILAVEESLGVQFTDDDIVAIKDVRALIDRVATRQ